MEDKTFTCELFRLIGQYESNSFLFDEGFTKWVCFMYFRDI